MLPTLHRRALAHIALAFTVLLASVLFGFPPARYSFYPTCPIYSAFGILCPGCGATRALAALLHGNLTDALHLNALAILLAPVALSELCRTYVQLLRNQPVQLTPPPRLLVISLTAAAVIFSILRNTSAAGPW